MKKAVYIILSSTAVLFALITGVFLGRLNFAQDFTINTSVQKVFSSLFEVTAPENTDLININTAGIDELDSLPGIGKTSAQRIINYRKIHGPFRDIKDIRKVSGINSNIFNKICYLICVD